MPVLVFIKLCLVFTHASVRVMDRRPDSAISPIIEYTLVSPARSRDNGWRSGTYPLWRRIIEYALVPFSSLSFYGLKCTRLLNSIFLSLFSYYSPFPSPLLLSVIHLILGVQTLTSGYTLVRGRCPRAELSASAAKRAPLGASRATQPTALRSLGGVHKGGSLISRERVSLSRWIADT